MDCNTRTVSVVSTFETVAIRSAVWSWENTMFQVERGTKKRLNSLSDLCLVFGLNPYM